ncbi:AAA family ATPase [Priestia megaterium]|uniref:AAA family ATPase n=1 Tax=Priestia megaterium TaxID=1404 RepID=UPI00211BB73C|nr:AAA family ATPase [Priestia megaterium]
MNFNLSDFAEPAENVDEFLKILVTGPSGSGKSTSVIYGAPYPLLVFDQEKGTSQYAKVKKFDLFQNKKINGFDPTDPNNILWYTEQLLAAQNQGFELPYKSILLDSGTVLYNRIINDYLKELRANGEPNKRKLEPNEYAFPKNKFYDIIRNLKALNVNLFVTAHASDNYLKSAFMKIDPNEPIKADCEKRLIHEMDVHYILSKQGKRHKATLKKGRIVDKEGRDLLPETIDNFDNFTLIPTIFEMASRDKGFEKRQSEMEQVNVIGTNAKLSQTIDNIVELVGALQLTTEQAVEALTELTGKGNPYELTEEEAEKAFVHFKGLVDAESGSVGE